MSLEKTIAQDLISAIKARDQATMRALRAIKSEILLFKTSGSGADLDEAAELTMLQKMAKQRQESLTIYEEQNREDLAIKEREELEVISKYLPEQMDADSLKDLLQKLVSELGADSMKDMGRVMGLANQRLHGKADGKTTAAIVKELLV